MLPAALKAAFMSLRIVSRDNLSPRREHCRKYLSGSGWGQMALQASTMAMTVPPGSASTNVDLPLPFWSFFACRTTTCYADVGWFFLYCLTCMTPFLIWTSFHLSSATSLIRRQAIHEITMATAPLVRVVLDVSPNNLTILWKSSKHKIRKQLGVDSNLVT